MKITALSDLHGTLPKIDPCDVVILAGDIVPLQIQRQVYFSQDWFLHEFQDWVTSIPCKRVIMIAGNHDFMLEYVQERGFKTLIHEMETRPRSGCEPPLMPGKLIYLQDSSYEYEGKVFYGCPWCVGPRGWSFVSSTGEYYQDIPEDVDVLICHQPPLVDKVGCSYPNTTYEREFGSRSLRTVIHNRRPQVVVCGHIHTGTHGGVNFNDTIIYNVSIKDEQYQDVYPVTTFEI
jgi:hypothetical protein